LLPSSLVIFNMAFLGLGVFYGGVIVGVPVVTGVAEGVHHQKEQNKEAANETRMVKFWIDSICESDKSAFKDEIEGMMVVLHKNGVRLSSFAQRSMPI
jgi:hypothetical protein